MGSPQCSSSPARQSHLSPRRRSPSSSRPSLPRFCRLASSLVHVSTSSTPPNEHGKSMLLQECTFIPGDFSPSTAFIEVAQGVNLELSKYFRAHLNECAVFLRLRHK